MKDLKSLEGINLHDIEALERDRVWRKVLEGIVSRLAYFNRELHEVDDPKEMYRLQGRLKELEYLSMMPEHMRNIIKESLNDSKEDNNDQELNNEEN